MSAETRAVVENNVRFDLSDTELASFHKNGYFGPFTIYEPDEMTRIWKQVRRQLFDRSHAAYKLAPDVGPRVSIANYDRHLDVPVLSRHVCLPEISHRLNRILGPDLLCWRSEFFPKYKGDEGTEWHQADTFAHASGKPQLVWPESEEFGGTITIWTAFTEAHEKNGCLRFIPGTHGAETRYYDETKGMKYAPDRNIGIEKDGLRRGFFGYDYRQLQIDPDWKPDESKAVSMVMRPGQAVMFWSTLMHSSFPNASETDEMRMGYAARYVPTRVRVYPDTESIEEFGGKISLENYGAVLVSGRDEYGYNRIRTHNMRGEPFSRS
ncbi:chlorinating enzyme [Corallococcus llansteffanensis]|uniref:Chlorinating enzyme n=1 Tax=Corallococcus llansteffanensis TaxID=2316731 RepID=A0A3A8R1I8_9BACT|nr:chlorinating enzyme [Corallococcus llansteffanensis]RKH69154.1 chlorinating enzyme [Corallococcus llansteffanensis]